VAEVQEWRAETCDASYGVAWNWHPSFFITLAKVGCEAQYDICGVRNYHYSPALHPGRLAFPSGFQLVSVREALEEKMGEDLAQVGVTMTICRSL
jgi:hypothetical protein